MGGFTARFSRSAPRLGGTRLGRFFASFDWPLFVTVVLLTGIGLLNLYSATYRTAHSGKFDRQLVWVSIGFALFLALTALDYHSLMRLAWPGLVVVIGAVLFVRLFTDPIKGSQRWLVLGSLQLQPSEAAKIAVILALARVLHDRAAEELPTDRLALAIFGLLLPVLLVAWQPDLGTAILLALLIGSVSFLLVKNLWPLTGGLVAFLAALPLLWDRMQPYQKGRILAFLDPSADPTGAGWHTQQSIFAIGSGKLTGKGFLGATQSNFNFLPEHWTDFPFSVWAEEWGFVGSLALLVLFAFLILWCVNVAQRAKDLFGTALCLGVAAMLFWHVVVNIAMVLGLAPVVGVTLPLISYGGSSILTFFVGLGLVSSVSLRRSR